MMLFVGRPPFYASHASHGFESVTQFVSEYSLERKVSDVGSATFSLKNITKRLINDFLFGGLMKTIYVYDDQTLLVWSGYIRAITINLTNISISVSLDGLATVIQIEYTDPFTNQTSTESYTDSAALADYGYITRTFSAGEKTAAEISALISLLAFSRKSPDIAKVIQESDETTIEIEASTFEGLLEFPYTGTGIYLPRSTIVTNIIQSDPNASFNAGYIEYDSFEVLESEEETSGLAAIKDLMNIGYDIDNKWIFYFQGKSFFFHTIKKKIEYVMRNGFVRDMGQRIVSPARIQPGSLIFFPEFAEGYPLGSFDTDPRIGIIESVVISSDNPDKPDLTIGQFSTLRSQLNSLGLGGM